MDIAVMTEPGSNQRDPSTKLTHKAGTSINANTSWISFVAWLKAHIRLGNRSSLRAELIRGSAGSLALALSSKLMMLFTSVLLARFMGASGYGVYATAMAMVLLLAVPTSLGLPILVLRLLARYHVCEEWGLMRGFLTRSNQVVLGLALLIAAVAAIIIWMLAGRLGSEKAVALELALGLVPLMTLGALRSAALRALRHVVLGQIPESIIVPVLFLALIAGWWAFFNGEGVLSPAVVVSARLVATAVAFLIGTALLVKYFPLAARHAQPRYEWRTWIRSAVPLLVLGGFSIVIMQTDVVMLAVLRGSESAGIYQAAARGAELVIFGQVIVNAAILPTFSRLYAIADMVRLQRVVTASARATLAVALPLALIAIFLGHPLMTLVFGDQFSRGTVALAILAGAQLVNAGVGSVGQILNMTGHERDAARSMAIGTAANVALNLLLIPVWDIEGAAVATGASLVLWNIISAVQVRRRLGLAPGALGIFA